MTLTKNKMVSEIGRRSRLKNRDVQVMLETLMDVWSETLVSGERIELEHLFVLEVQAIDRGEQRGVLRSGCDTYPAPHIIQRLTVRASKRLKSLLTKSV